MPSKLTDEQLEQFLEVIDTALLSDTPAVVNALQNLAMVVGLTGEHSRGRGPMGNLLQRLNRVEQDLNRLLDVQRQEEMRQYYEKYRQSFTSTTGYSYDREKWDKI